ncbi:MAG: hypothetical protein KGL12_03550 [Rhodospirillales bacterium]|nr:hypothetical protein [Rhodospirillales bacterium]
MTTAGRNRVWNAGQVAAQLLALNGAAPEPQAYVGYRDRTLADGSSEAGYELPGEPHLLSPSAFEFWLARRGLAGPERLAVAVLVIREVLDSAGMIETCTLERRRGLAEGPYHGEPARVEFTGPARIVRLFQASADGTLSEMPLSADAPVLHEPLAVGFEGDIAALRARFGEAVMILDMREPNVLEEAAGFAAIGHIRRADGQGSGCGVLWHGTAAFVLEAAFPPLPVPLPAPAEQAALAEALRRAGLIGYEWRIDRAGQWLMARRPHSTALFRLALAPARPPLPISFVPDPDPDIALPAQRQWLRYAAKYERLTILDCWAEPEDDALNVLSGDAGGLVWRHQIDAGGVEAWRMAQEESAVGSLFRDRRLGLELDDEADGAPLGADPPVFIRPEAPSRMMSPDAPPTLFSAALIEAFPDAAHDMEEAEACHLSGRGTAAVFHAARIAAIALRSVARAQGAADPLAGNGRRFSVLAPRVQALAPAAATPFAALRHAWHGPALRAAAKYTEAEAAAILVALATLVATLAPLADEGEAEE